jgi:glycine cleavage system regulatory protein
MASFVISVLGDDRAGLVEALSAVIAEHGGNWEQSHMTQLAGKFAGVVLVVVPDQRSEGFTSALHSLEHTGLLHLSFEEGREVEMTGPTIEIRVMGTDQPGIVHELSQLLASHKVSIDDLETATSPAPMAGGQLFEAVAKLRLPAGLSEDALVDEIGALASDLMVDVEVIHEGFQT